MRLFVALKLSDDMIGALQSACTEIKRLSPNCRLTDSRNLHLTLAFIGETDRLSAAKRAVWRACEACGSFELTVSGSGSFGNIIYACADGSGLNNLAQAVRRELAAESIDFDCKPFRPHITLAREAEPRLKIDIRKCSAAACTVQLLRSDRSDGRPVYTPVLTKELK